MVRTDAGVSDGGRRRRTLDRMRLALPRGGTLIARLAAESAPSVVVRSGTRVLATVPLTGAAFDEVTIPLPTAATPAAPLEVEATSGTFASFHYWALPPCAP